MPDHSVQVNWQAHRGGGAYEAPDNTMAANRYTWQLGGIPEADIRTTRDGIIVCLHDETPARTTTVPSSIGNRPISGFDFADTRAWDAGIKFDVKFAGERIPSLEEVFADMRGRPERKMYLDLKDTNLEQLGRLIDEYNVNEQVIFTHNQYFNCKNMKRIADGVRTMLWIGGTSEQIRLKYEHIREAGFADLDQVQFHLNSKKSAEEAEWRYQLDRTFVNKALEETSMANVDLEVLPFEFDSASIHGLLDLGIRWYATDEPARFLQCVRSWRGGMDLEY